MFSNWVGTGGDGGEWWGWRRWWGWSRWRTECCPVCPPWPPPQANMSNVWTAGILCVQICPPTHHYPSSFFQTICTKDPDKGAQSPPRMSARVRKLLLHAKECVCALNENISFVRFFDQREDRFEGNIYNTPRHKPLMSKSFHSLKPTLQNKSSRCQTKNKTQNVKD